MDSTGDLKRDAIIKAAKGEIGMHFTANQLVHAVKAKCASVQFTRNDALEVIGAIGILMAERKAGK